MDDQSNERVVQSLKRLASIEKGQRISSKAREGEIVIEEEGPFQWIYRFIRGETREDNLRAADAVFTQAYRDIYKYLQREEHYQMAQEGLTTSRGAQYVPLTAGLDRTGNLQRLATNRRYMEEGIAGVLNLLPTYDNRNDQNTVSDIRSMGDRVRGQLRQIDHSIAKIRDKIPKDVADVIGWDTERTVSFAPHDLISRSAAASGSDTEDDASVDAAHKHARTAILPKISRKKQRRLAAEES